MTENDFIWILWWVWLALGFKWALGRISKKSAEKKQAAFQAEAKARRELRSDKRPTASEALESELTAIHSRSIRGDNWTIKANPIIARNILDDDLGRFAEGPAPYHLEQDKRDILLANARKDAAEALLNTQALLKEVHALKSALDNFGYQLFWLGAAFLLWTWWKSGFALWDWVKWWDWLK